jgi:hypothetical protein
MATLLTYAPATQFPIRLRRLSLGAGVLALGFAFPILWREFLWSLFFPRTRVMQIIFSFIPDVPYCLAILLGVFLLASALPPLPRHAGRFRWKMIAATSLAVCLFVLVSLMRLDALLFSLKPSLGSHAADIFLSAVICTVRLTQLALVVCGAFYLAAVGARLERKTLGLIAACAMLPSALMMLTALAYSVFWEIYLLTSWNFPLMDDLDSAKETCMSVNRYALLIIWGAVALLAGNLALRKPRQTDSHLL